LALRQDGAERLDLRTFKTEKQKKTTAGSPREATGHGCDHTTNKTNRIAGCNNSHNAGDKRHFPHPQKLRAIARVVFASSSNRSGATKQAFLLG
jgi:hypothetical protein